MGTPEAGERDPVRARVQVVRIERRRSRIAQRMIEAAKRRERDPLAWSRPPSVGLPTNKSGGPSEPVAS
jgi:hypothetical protein